MSGSSYVRHNLGLRDADGGVVRNTDLSSIKSKSRRPYSHLDESIGRTIARYPGHLLLKFFGFFGYSR